MKKTKVSTARAASAPAARDWFDSRILLVIVAIMVLVAFLPLTRYYFAQDDFILMHRASSEPGKMFGEFWSDHSGQFRPLTKVGYFNLMYAAFGLNARPYHYVSLLLHIVNVVLFFVLMRRLGIGRLGAIVATQLFALNMAFFHVIAWISCIQQIAALAFLLLSLIFGVDLLKTGSRRALVVSLAAYALTLMSLEQTYAVPILLVLVGALGLGVERRPVVAVARVLWPHLALLVAYVLFMGVWKSPPTAGMYAVQVGWNVPINLATYVGWAYEFWQILPVVMARQSVQFTPSHIVFAVLLTYHLVRRRYAWMAFALAFFVLCLLPAALLSLHTFYLHTYVPSFGAMLLIALLVDDIFRAPALRRETIQIAVLSVILIGGYVGTFKVVRSNERGVLKEVPRMRSSFVLRRALIAQQVVTDLEAKRGDHSGIKQVYMVYGRAENPEEASWNTRNVREAIGRGAAIKLLYDKPGLDVWFKLVGDTISAFNPELSQLFVYGDFGAILTYDEANASIGTDTTTVRDVSP